MPAWTVDDNIEQPVNPFKEDIDDDFVRKELRRRLLAKYREQFPVVHEETPDMSSARLGGKFGTYDALQSAASQIGTLNGKQSDVDANYKHTNELVASGGKMAQAYNSSEANRDKNSEDYYKNLEPSRLAENDADPTSEESNIYRSYVKQYMPQIAENLGDKFDTMSKSQFERALPQLSKALGGKVAPSTNIKRFKESDMEIDGIPHYFDQVTGEYLPISGGINSQSSPDAMGPFKPAQKYGSRKSKELAERESAKEKSRLEAEGRKKTEFDRRNSITSRQKIGVEQKKQEFQISQKKEQRSRLSDKQAEGIGTIDKALAFIESIKAKKKNFDTGPLASVGNWMAKKVGQDNPEFTAFKADVNDQLVQYVKEISGTAASDKERAAISQNMPSTTDNDATFILLLEGLANRLKIERQTRLKTFNKIGKNTGAFESPDTEPNALESQRKVIQGVPYIKRNGKWFKE